LGILFDRGKFGLIADIFLGAYLPGFELMIDWQIVKSVSVSWVTASIADIN
jgi:hypothetical protein